MTVMAKVELSGDSVRPARGGGGGGGGGVGDEF